MLGASAIARGVQLLLRNMFLDISTLFRYLRRGVATVIGALGVTVSAVLHYTGLFIEAVLLPLRLWVRAADLALTHLWSGAYAAAGYASRALLTVGRYMVVMLTSAIRGLVWPVVRMFFTSLWLAMSALSKLIGFALRLLRLGISGVLGYLRLGLFVLLQLLIRVMIVIVGYLSLVFSAIGKVFGLIFGYLHPPAIAFLGYIWLGVTTVTQVVSLLTRHLWLGASMVLRHLSVGASGPLHLASVAVLKAFWYLWLGASTAVLVLRWARVYSRRGLSLILRGVGRSPAFAARTVGTGLTTAPDVWRMLVRVVRDRKGVSLMSEFDLTRERVLSLVATVWLFGLIGFIVAAYVWPPPPEPTVKVVHWATGHLTRDGLLPEMAEEFNAAGHRTASGKKIDVEVYNVPSELQGKYLSGLLRFGTRIDLHKVTDGYVVKDPPDPTMVTPSSAHWLVTVNHEVGRVVADLDAAESIVRPVIGIVTYEEMARCLGWPDKKLGYADILALRADPNGWASYPCARAEWGQRPLIAFTDPSTSSTGRSLHLALYSFAASKPPEELTIADVLDPEVVAYVKEFQGLIDHYLIGTTVLNTKIHQGPRYGHFFIMPEDNLIHLVDGTEKAFINGEKVAAPPIDSRMVMIYPKEGSMPRNNCACIVQADWVSEEQAEASRQ